MRATSVRTSSSAHDDPITAMSWHRRRIRRARRRNGQSAPQTVTRVAQDSGNRSPLIRRLVVFVPRGTRGARAAGAVLPPGEPGAAPGPA
jgi:hypothetical protein